MANYKEIDQVLDLVHKTGDKIIVVSEHHNPYILMSVKDYEALLHNSSSVNKLTEEELLEKINRDIAIWKASQDDLDDYDLESFKVDSIKREAKTKGKDALSFQQIDQSQKAVDSTQSQKSDIQESKAEQDDRYYVEPVD